MPTTIFVVGIFSRKQAPATSGVVSPFQPSDALEQIALAELYKNQTAGITPMSRELALRIGAVKRAHGLHVTLFSQTPFYRMDGDKRADDQPGFLTDSRSGMSPYHQKVALASDLFFNGWACQAFTPDLSDSAYVPYGQWGVDPATGDTIVSPDAVPARYTLALAIPMGYGENGLLVDGADTIRQARAIDAAYNDRLQNPVPLTILNIPMDVWQGWTKKERGDFRDAWIRNRRSENGSTAMKPDSFGVDMPGQTSVDLYESGRNAVRLDVANHTSTPASLLEGVRQGGSGGGSEIKYSGVENGATRNELWDYGLGRRMVLAYEARLSLNDFMPLGASLRGDASNYLAVPSPPTSPTSKD